MRKNKRNMKTIVIQPAELQELIQSSLEAVLKQYVPPQPEQQNLPEYMTRKEVADYLSCSLATVDNYSREGTLQKRYIHGLPRFKREEVQAALASL